MYTITATAKDGRKLQIEENNLDRFRLGDDIMIRTDGESLVVAHGIDPFKRFVLNRINGYRLEYREAES